MDACPGTEEKEMKGQKKTTHGEDGGTSVPSDGRRHGNEGKSGWNIEASR